jgi:hypothetical protein
VTVTVTASVAVHSRAHVSFSFYLPMRYSASGSKGMGLAYWRVPRGAETTQPPHRFARDQSGWPSRQVKKLEENIRTQIDRSAPPRSFLHLLMLEQRIMGRDSTSVGHSDS